MIPNDLIGRSESLGRLLQRWIRNEVKFEGIVKSVRLSEVDFKILDHIDPFRGECIKRVIGRFERNPTCGLRPNAFTGHLGFRRLGFHPRTIVLERQCLQLFQALIACSLVATFSAARKSLMKLMYLPWGIWANGSLVLVQSNIFYDEISVGELTPFMSALFAAND